MYGDLVRCKLRVYAALLCTREWQKEGVCVCVCVRVCVRIFQMHLLNQHTHILGAPKGMAGCSTS